MSNLQQYSGLTGNMARSQPGLRTTGAIGLGGGSISGSTVAGGPGNAGGYPSYNQLLNRQQASMSNGDGNSGGGGFQDYLPSNGPGSYQPPQRQQQQQQRVGGMPTASASSVAALQKLQQQQQQAVQQQQQQLAARAAFGGSNPGMPAAAQSVRAGGRFSQMDSFENDFPALPNAGHGSFNANDFQPHSDDFPALPGPQSFKDDLGFLGSASSQQQQQNNYYQSSKNTFGGSNSDLDSMSKLRISDGPLQKAKTTGPIGSSAVGAPIGSGVPIGSSAVGGPIGSSAVGAPIGSGAMLGGGSERYGLMGILNVIRMAEPDLSTLAIGSDLTGPLYSIFVSPWADGSSRREPDYRLPQCYHLAAPQNPIPKIATFSDDTLFYVFYSMPRDQMQELAAQQLYMRNWRFHKERKIWLTRDPSAELIEKTEGYERGLYICFDVKLWERVRMELTLRYDALEERVIPQGNASGASAGPNAAPSSTGGAAGKLGLNGPSTYSLSTSASNSQ